MGATGKLPCWSGAGHQHNGEKHRLVLGNASHQHQGYLNNYTRTTKYTLLTFFPKALFEQYRRVANIYFTLVAALSLTEFTPVRPWTTWTPLVIVLGVSMVKEAVEDYKRYKADKEVNNRPVEVLHPASGKFVTKRWKEVVVGEVIIVRKDDQFAADVLFLSAENEEGTCYVETMNLDGETNLKIKKALDQTKDYMYETLPQFRGMVQCEHPNSRLYQFGGNLILEEPSLEGPSPNATLIPINPAAILLRGCCLRNTERVFGLVIYAGHESKIFKNSTQAPSKRSSVERIVDKVIIFMFSLLFAMCMCGCVYFAFWTSRTFPDSWYLGPQSKELQYDYDRPVVVAVTNFITVFILYGYLIPISMYVTMEMVKIVQSMFFIGHDRNMYHAESDTPALARTSNLNEELGMVNTVLSDKTGTLTCNVMEFFKCSIAGVSYGAGVTEIERSNAARRGVELAISEDPAAAQYREQYFNFFDKRLMGSSWATAKDPLTIEMFFRLLAVCHTVIPDGEPTVDAIKYEAESPDEAALVVAAKVFGFFCFKRTNTSVSVRETTSTGTRDVEYEVLNILEFNSTRKRMSVIVRDDKGRIIVFCKGADTVIYERLDHSHPQNEAVKTLTTQHMEEYGGAGLRTLCLSYTELDPEEYATWQVKYIEAKTSLEDRDAKVAAVSELVERNLRLLGCTAIEDKLQDGVPECIKQLANGGIRLWVLTGDKQETAINIGFACSLITEDMDQFIVSAYCPELDELEAANRMEEAAKVGNARVQESLLRIESEMAARGGSRRFALIIDGKALSFALSDRLSKLFLKVGLQCAAVICCRVSPLQKAQVTGLVRSHGDVTLAIGDGANDVGMIQRAHIGVGISGKEGMQAVMSADFAIAQFRFLLPLLMVHGRWSYKRITRMINFFFYKNLMFGITIFTFNAFTAFSGQYLYNDFYMTLFNVIFTSLTPLAIGMFDRDVDREMGLRYPSLYKQGQRNQYFSFWSIVGWLATASYQAAVIMVLVLVGCSSTTTAHSSGQPWGMWETGVLMFSVVLVTVHLQVIQLEEQWTWLHHLAIWLSQAIWWVYLLAYGAFPLYLSSDLYYLFAGIVGQGPQYWLYLLLIPLACQLPDFFFRQIRRHLYPEDHHVIQELQLQEVKEANAMRKQTSQLEPESQKVVQKVFEHRTKNKGFVPPYDPQSRFYRFISQARPLSSSNAASSKSSNSIPEATEGSSMSQVGLQTGVRNPVLQHLDQELITRGSLTTANSMINSKSPSFQNPILSHTQQQQQQQQRSIQQVLNNAAALGEGVNGPMPVRLTGSEVPGNSGSSPLPPHQVLVQEPGYVPGIVPDDEADMMAAYTSALR